jgi:DNA-binding beta-propeller fold protein YncE
MRELVTQIRAMPDGIAVDTVNKHIYWTNMGVPSANDGTIQRCDLSGSNIVTIVPKGWTHTPKQLIIAPLSKKLYWSDREGERIMRANVDGSDIEVLYRASCENSNKSSLLHWCVGIAVDEESNTIFWTQKGPSKGNKGRIFRMGLDFRVGEMLEDRSDVECLLDNLPEPIDLEFDHASKTLYWTDRGDPPRGNTVNSVVLANLPANKLQPKILVRKLHEGIGISLDLRSSRIFFGDLGGSLYSCNLDGSCKHTILPDMGGAITGVAYAEP